LNLVENRNSDNGISDHPKDESANGDPASNPLTIGSAAVGVRFPAHGVDCALRSPEGSSRSEGQGQVAAAATAAATPVDNGEQMVYATVACKANLEYEWTSSDVSGLTDCGS
jgi:hypothetical protein